MFCCFTVKSFLNMSLPTAGMVIAWFSVVINFSQLLFFCKTEILTYLSFQINLYEILSPFFMFAIIVAFLDLIASVMLIFGVTKGKHLLVLPWLINNGITLVFKFLLLCVFTLVTLASENQTFAKHTLIPFLWIILVFLCFVWNAIYSLLKSIRKSKEDEEADVETRIGNPNSFGFVQFKD